MLNSSNYNLIGARRENFRTEIRKKQTENVFQAKRTRLLKEKCIEVENIDNNQIMQKISDEITKFDNLQDLITLEQVINSHIILQIIIKLRIYCCKLLEQEDQTQIMNKVAELFTENGALSYIVEIADIKFPQLITLNATWILVNLSLAKGISSRLVFDTTLLEKIVTMISSNHSVLIEIGLQLLSNLIADSDYQIFEYFIDLPNVSNVFLYLANISPQISKLASNTLLQITLQLVQNNDNYYELPFFETLLLLLGKYTTEGNCVKSIYVLLDQDPSDSYDSTIQIIQKGYGLLARIINQFEKMISSQEEKSDIFKYTLAMIVRVSEFDNLECQNFLQQLRIISIISKILSHLQRDSILQQVFDIMHNLSDNDTFLQEVSPYILQELKIHSQSQSIMTEEKSKRALIKYLSRCDPQYFMFTIELCGLQMIIDALQYDSALDALLILSQVLYLEDQKYLNQIGYMQGWEKLQQLTTSTNQQIQDLASNILNQYEELGSFI